MTVEKIHSANVLSSVNEGRTGSSVDAAAIVNDGDASVTLTKIKVQDEGTYICTVSLGPFQAQQIIQLQVLRKFQFYCLKSESSSDNILIVSMSLFVSEPPHVSLSEDKLILKENSPQTLSCRCTKYYPLDVQVGN